MAQVNRSFEFGDAPGGVKEWHKLMQREGYDLSKFELVAVPEEFSDASGTDQIGHGGLLEYDGVLDVEGSDTEEESCVDPAEGFNVTIEHVGDDLNNQGSGLVHLLEVPPNMSETKHYHKDDILDVGIEACDLKSLLEQFEESEQPQIPVVQKQDSVSLPDPRLAPRPVPPPEPQPAPKEQTRYKIATTMKELPNPADVVKKIAPVKRKGAILLDPDALPLKKTKPKPVSQNPEVNKAIHLARSTHRASPIPFNLKNLIPVPKYLSLEHDYCMSPAASDKSNASDLSNQMSKEQRRAYYKYKYKVKKKIDGVDSPSKCSSVSSSPRSMSPASMSPNPTVSEVSDGKVPNASMPNPPAPVPLFDKIPGYFSKKLLVGMYREIDSANPSKPVHQGYDQNIFVNNENSDGGRMDNPQFGRQSRPQVRRRHRRSYRDSRRKNSLSSQSDSSYCSSCSEHQSNPGDDDLERETRSRNPARHVRRRRRTRDSICSARSRGSRSPSYSRSRSPSYSSYSDCGSLRRSRSFSRSRSRSFSRSRSRSYSRSPSYSRSRSRSRSYSCSRSRSRSPRDYSRRSRSYSRSLSRSPHRTRRSSSRRLSRSSHSRSRTRSRARSRGRSRARSRSCHYNGSKNNNKRSDSCIRTFDPVEDNKEVKYTDEQLQEFEERRVVYVGNIENDTTRQDLMRQFSRFGPVDKIQLYFRDDMDNYGFVTFRYKCDAVAAITAGHDPNWPKYDLCFGGRRKFCMKKYEDLDSLNKASAELEFGYHGNEERKEEVEEEPEESEFDKLLKAAMKSKNKRR